MGQAKLRKDNIDKLKAMNESCIKKFKYAFIVRYDNKFTYAVINKTFSDVLFNDISYDELIASMGNSAFKYCEEHLSSMIYNAEKYMLQSCNKAHFLKTISWSNKDHYCIVLYINFKSIKETNLCLIESTSIATVNGYNSMRQFVSKEFETNSNGVLLEME